MDRHSFARIYLDDKKKAEIKFKEMTTRYKKLTGKMMTVSFPKFFNFVINKPMYIRDDELQFLISRRKRK